MRPARACPVQLKWPRRKITDLRRHPRELRREAACVIDSGMHRQHKNCVGPRNAQKLFEGFRADMALGECSGAHAAGITGIRQYEMLREVRHEGLPVNLFCSRDPQHVGRYVDAVDRADPPRAQRLGDKAGSGANIEHRALAPQRREVTGHDRGAAVGHAGCKVAVIARSPVAVVAHGILRGPQGIGSVEFVVLSGHAAIRALRAGPVKTPRLAASRFRTDSRAMKRTLLIFGHGYSAAAFVRRLGPGWRVIGTTRRPEKAERLRAAGVEAHLWPGDDLGPAIDAASHVLLSIAPDASGDPVAAAFGEDLARAAPHLAWVGYLSTTGVYGDHGGDWVDEMTPLTPSTDRGRFRVKAEAQWQEIAARSGLPLHIFRLAGIYGPGRGPFEKVRNGTARRIIKENQYFSRIHVEDIANVLAASVARPNPGAIYNVADDDPSPPEEVLAEAARLLALPLPPEERYEAAEMTPMARSFYAESKRVRNGRIKTDLGVRLSHPDYRSGLRALLAGGE